MLGSKFENVNTRRLEKTIRVHMKSVNCVLFDICGVGLIADAPAAEEKYGKIVFLEDVAVEESSGKKMRRKPPTPLAASPAVFSLADKTIPELNFFDI